MHAQVLRLGSSARQRGPGLSRTHILTKSAPIIEGKSRDLLWKQKRPTENLETATVQEYYGSGAQLHALYKSQLRVHKCASAVWWS
jgi:hypothetical protein